MMKLRILFAAGVALFVLDPAHAQTGHIATAAIDKILAEAEGISKPDTARIPASLPLSAALFANRPWWAVLQMCSEHRTGAGKPPGAPLPVLDEAGERNRKFFMVRAMIQFAKEQGMTPADAAEPVGQWGSQFGATMNAAAATGDWSSSEFEDACRILGPAHLRAAVRPPSP
jgi:hypothetical protein